MSTTRGVQAAGRRGDTLVAGLAYSVAAYLLWGILPIYFTWLKPTGPYEVVAWRVLLSIVFCVILLAVTNGWRRFGSLWRDGRIVGWLVLAAFLIAVNWTVFVVATSLDEVVEASLGYFINPIITILLGVVFLRERLRPLQWVAVAVSVVAIVVLTVGVGSFPWIAILLSLSFGFYSFAKNRTGGRVEAISGLAFETTVLTPFAAITLILISVHVPVLDPTGAGIVYGTVNGWHTFAMSLAGVITAIPLIFFAAGARRLPLSYVGLTQYLAPVLQFLTGVFLLGEPMSAERWIGFGVVWLAIVLLIVDTVIAIGHARRAQRVPVAA